MIKYFSTFSGIAGFELGIGDKGECVGFSEIDKYAIQVYQKHFPNHKAFGDITKIAAESIPDFDMLCGGFPCQAFSIAGKRGGFDDTRGTLFFELVRIARVKKPRLLFFENVKGLLSHDRGRTFDTIIRTIDELGYDVQWQVLNSKNFGVPQNRERVFIIGHLRGTSRPQVFPFRQNGSPSAEGRSKGIQQIASTLKAKDYSSWRGNFLEAGDANELQFIGAVMSEKKWLENGKDLSRNFPQGNRVYSTDGVSSTLSSQGGGLGAKTGLYAVAERGRYKEDGTTEQKLEPRMDGLTNTLTGVEKDNRVSDGMKIRRLTPIECERLQGFPDNWTENVSDTQRYKCCGNAVSVPVIKAIAERLLA